MVLIINIYKIVSQQNHISVKAVCSNGSKCGSKQLISNPTNF